METVVCVILAMLITKETRKKEDRSIMNGLKEIIAVALLAFFIKLILQFSFVFDSYFFYVFF